MHDKSELQEFRGKAIQLGLMAPGSHAKPGAKRFIFDFNHGTYYVPDPTPERISQLITLAGMVKDPDLLRMLYSCAAEISRLESDGYALWTPGWRNLPPEYLSFRYWLLLHNVNLV